MKQNIAQKNRIINKNNSSGYSNIYIEGKSFKVRFKHEKVCKSFKCINEALLFRNEMYKKLNYHNIMNKLEIFKFEKQDIRMQVDSFGNPWFCVKDICDCLGLTNPSKSVENIDKDDLTISYTIDSLGRKQNSNFVNESGLYQLIFQSRKEESKIFKKWVTSEVLPTIRKTGSYSITQKTDSYQIEDPIERATRWIEEQKEKVLLLNENNNLKTALDTLNDWASIIRVAKFNNVSEKLFSWKVLKAKSKELGFEIKVAPCPRFGTKNLYNINVFRLCYPKFNYDFDENNLEN